jgi:hypothetical protein
MPATSASVAALAAAAKQHNTQVSFNPGAMVGQGSTRKTFS